MTAILFDAENQASGTTMSAANTGMTIVTPGTGNTATFQTAAAAHGSRGYRLALAGANAATLRPDDSAFSGGTRIRCAWNMKMSASPGGALQLGYWLNAANTVLLPRVIINTNRTLGVQNSVNTTIFTTTTAIPLNTLYRVELVWIPGTTTSNGTIGFGIVPLDDVLLSSSSDYFWATNVNLGANSGVGRWHLGKLSGSWTGNLDYDDIRADDAAFTSDPATWLGPVVPPVTSIDRLRVGANAPLLRVGANAVTSAYVGATQIWP